MVAGLSYFLGNDGNDVAVKSPHEQATHANREEFLAEIEFMKQLPFHPHILSLVGCSTNPEYPLIVTGICELGALLSLLRQMDPEHLNYEESPLEFDDLVPIGWQISDALVFLSAKEIVHRDVAARNVLVTKDKTAKLSDFGLCRFQKDMVAGVRDGKFPIKWMAPEAIEFADFSPECDVWSFGVLLYEMYNYGKSPWSDVEPAELLPLLKEGKRLKIPFTAPEFILKTSATCWEENPEDRPRFEDIRERFYKEMEDHAKLYGYLDVCKRYYTLLEPTSEATEDFWEHVEDEKF
ncbi:unnamed protein product, partial [Mesorhabditis belari]|uniref:Protein kinase domain-containing protein n=1 Tax=Mesorhabditis belari TaxID=2138241 RepID=A0AAF3F9Y8_9BILA